jgi:DNA-binding transcriptional LysR family regulator
VDFRHLRAFVTVAEERSFTKAAQRLHISQPPLTRYVRQLENELGVSLFVRSRHGADLTRDGRVLFEKARTASMAIADFQGAAQSIAPPHGRTLTVGIVWGLWEAVNRIRAHHAERCPGMRLDVQDLCLEHRDPLEAPRIDVVVTRPPVDETLFESEPLFDERFVALLADTHPLASRSRVRLSELVAEPLLLYERSVGPGVYDKTLALFGAAGLRPSVVEAQPPPYSQGAMMLVASHQGFYVGIASPFTQTHRASGVAVVPIDEPDAHLGVRIAWRRNDSSSKVRQFLCSARDVFPREAKRGRRQRSER